MEHCRDDYDQLLLALARFGGLRIPSEVRLLRFSDFKENVILIHPETKTGTREIPLFGEIREIIDRIQADLGKNYQPSDLVFAQLGGFRKRIVSAICADVQVGAVDFLGGDFGMNAAQKAFIDQFLDSFFIADVIQEILRLAHQVRQFSITPRTTRSI